MRWLISSLYSKYKEFLENRKKKRQLSTANFRALTEEIREMANLSCRVWRDNKDFLERIKRISNEMDHLESLLQKREFERLSTDKKEELRKSLLLSREELLKSLQEAPCPTQRLQ
ncbi:MAG: hypothetical protein ACOCZ2_05075 [Thermodesulfobacteriota bacterium]